MIRLYVITPTDSSGRVGESFAIRAEDIDALIKKKTSALISAMKKNSGIDMAEFHAMWKASAMNYKNRESLAKAFHSAFIRGNPEYGYSLLRHVGLEQDVPAYVPESSLRKTR